MANTVTVTLPTPTIVINGAVSGAQRTGNSVSLTLPTPTFAAVGREGDGHVTGTVTITLPKPKLAITGQLVGTVTLKLPTPTLVGVARTFDVGTAALTLPIPTLAAHGRVTTVGTVGLTLPAPTLHVTSGNRAALTLPAPKIAVRATTGVLGTVQLVLPAVLLAATGKVPVRAGVVLTLPTPKLAIVGKVGNTGAMAAALRGIALAAHGATGVVGTCRLVLPISGTLGNGFKGGISATGYTPAVGTVTLILPMLLLRAIGTEAATISGAAPDSAALPALVMHTETGALSQYLNYPFNSFARFNGVTLGANAEGLFVIASGNVDNTAAISAAARVGITDFGTSFLKRVDRCYVGYRADGNITLRVYTDEINVRDYLLEAYGKGGLHGNHTRIGKGVAARYWQFELISSGADFELNVLELKPTHLRRRVGGGDA